MRLLALVAALSSVPAFAATAYFTGNMEHVTTVTGRSGVSCEYNYAGSTFWRTFSGSRCPNRIEVE